MKKTLEKLWDEYLADELAAIETEEERKLVKRSVELREAVNALLNKEQQQAIEKFVDLLYELEEKLTKKAFFKGCEFAVSFILESGNFLKTKE